MGCSKILSLVSTAATSEALAVVVVLAEDIAFSDEGCVPDDGEMLQCFDEAVRV